MENIKTLIDNETIQEKINQLAQKINEDYAGKKLTMICILKGAVYFFADLSRKVNLDTEICFMRISSYTGENSTGKIDIKIDLEEDIKGKDVLVVEDIIDTGKSLSFLKNYLLEKKPNSVKICTLLDKPERRKEDFNPDYVGFVIPDRFVIGYGMDYNEAHRTLPDVDCITKENDKKLNDDIKAIKLQLKR